jgi:hypothetical protein
MLRLFRIPQLRGGHVRQKPAGARLAGASLIFMDVISEGAERKSLIDPMKVVSLAEL